MANTKVTQELIADDAIGAAQLASNAVVTASIANDAVTSAKLDTNLAVAGSLTIAGTVTANAGVNIDNISIDGTTMALSSGDLLLDVAGDIILDADGGDIRFKDGGTEIGSISMSGSNVSIISAVQDEDIFFKGNDGGSVIDALTLDMSDAGSAIFNHDIFLSDNSAIRLGAGTGDLKIYHDGSNSYIDDAGTGSLVLLSSEVLIDSAGDITLDAAGNDILLKDAGTTFGQFSNDSGQLIIYNAGSQMLKGNTGSNALFVGNVTASTSANITQQPLATSGTTIAWNAATHANAYLVPAANLTIGNPSNPVEGAIISVEIAMNGTPRTIAWHANFEFAASTTPTATATANKTDIFSFRYNGSQWQEIGRVQNLAQT